MSLNILPRHLCRGGVLRAPTSSVTLTLSTSVWWESNTGFMYELLNHCAFPLSALRGYWTLGAAKPLRSTFQKLSSSWCKPRVFRFLSLLLLPAGKSNLCVLKYTLILESNILFLIKAFTCVTGTKLCTERLPAHMWSFDDFSLWFFKAASDNLSHSLQLTEQEITLDEPKLMQLWGGIFYILQKGHFSLTTIPLLQSLKESGKGQQNAEPPENRGKL